MWLYSCVHTDQVHCSLLNFRRFPLVGSIFMYPLVVLSAFFQLFQTTYHCYILYGMTYILQVIAIHGLASHKH